MANIKQKERIIRWAFIKVGGYQVVQVAFTNSGIFLINAPSASPVANCGRSRTRTQEQGKTPVERCLRRCGGSWLCGNHTRIQDRNQQQGQDP